MRALETGQPLPNRTLWPAALTLTAIGAGVPIAAFFFTLIATLNGSVPGEIWIAPVVTTFFTTLLTGSLAPNLLGSARPAPGPDSLANDSKPSFDPDAYDVVGRRG